MRDDVGTFIWNMAVADEKYRKSGAYASDHREWVAAKDSAFVELAKSNDSLVSWIAKHPQVRSSYIHEAIEILKVLPATIHQLDEVSRNHNWCGVWNNLRTEALRDGVIEINYEFEWRENAGRWHDMRQSIMVGRRIQLKREDIMPSFICGASSVQLEVNEQFYTIRLKTS